MEGIFDIRLIKDFALGDLKCPLKFEMRSATNSFNWSFHSEIFKFHLFSFGPVFCIEINGFQKHWFCCFPVDPIHKHVLFQQSIVYCACVGFQMEVTYVLADITDKHMP